MLLCPQTLFEDTFWTGNIDLLTTAGHWTGNIALLATAGHWIGNIDLLTTTGHWTGNIDLLTTAGQWTENIDLLPTVGRWTRNIGLLPDIWPAISCYCCSEDQRHQANLLNGDIDLLHHTFYFQNSPLPFYKTFKFDVFLPPCQRLYEN